MRCFPKLTGPRLSEIHTAGADADADAEVLRQTFLAALTIILPSPYFTSQTGYGIATIRTIFHPVGGSSISWRIELHLTRPAVGSVRAAIKRCWILLGIVITHWQPRTRDEGFR